MAKVQKILIVEDDVLVLKTLQKLLETEGFELRSARNGDEALGLLKHEQVDLVISDIRMPGKDGIKTLTEWRQFEEKESLPHTPMILITGYASEEAPIDALKLGVSDYILKPFNSEELISSVKRALASKNEEAPSLTQLVQEIRNLIEQYETSHSREIEKTENLIGFFKELDKIVFSLEKKLLSFESRQNE